MIKFALEQNEIDELIKALYGYFSAVKSPYDFEKFLKPVLESLGLDQIKVTKRSRDGGVDLECVREGLGGVINSDETKFKVQAKRYKPESSISVKQIRELKGVLTNGEKGIFVTTSKFSSDAIKEAGSDLARPIVLIDGQALVEQCVKAGIGIKMKPSFSESILDELLKDEKVVTSVSSTGTSATSSSAEKLIATKMVTENDIKRRIISLPSEANVLVPAGAASIMVILGEGEPVNCTYTESRKMISGITDFLRSKKLLNSDGTIDSKQANWYFNESSKIFRIEIK